MNDFANMTDSTATDPNRTGPTIGTPIIPPVRMRQNGLELAWFEAHWEDARRTVADLQGRLARNWKWQAFVAFTFFLIGAVCGKAF